MATAVRPGGWLLVEDADYCSLVAADRGHPLSSRFDAIMRKLLVLIAAGRAFDPFFGRSLPGLAVSAGLADAGHEAIACHRQGAGSAAEVLARSLERTRNWTLGDGAVGPGEFATVLSALRDPSFSFVDALSVAGGAGPPAVRVDSAALSGPPFGPASDQSCRPKRAGQHQHFPRSASSQHAQRVGIR